MSYRNWLARVAVILVVVLMALASFAATSQAPQVTSSGSPTDDIYVASTPKDAGGLKTSWTFITPPGSATTFVLLKFNLDNLTTGWAASDHIVNAKLSLYLLPALCGSDATEYVSLYGMASAFAWSESSMPTWSDTLIAAGSATPLRVDADVPLLDPATPGYYNWSDQTTFANWLDGQRANHTVTLMLKVRTSASSIANIYFEDNELSGKAGQCGVTTNNPPVLMISSVPPSAVTMSTFRSVDPAVNWPLIIGLVALVAVVIGGLAVTRKRAASR